MPHFGKLVQREINGNATVTICFDEQESLAIDPRSITDPIAHQYASEALRSIGFKPPMLVVDWRLKLHRYRDGKSEVWLDVEYT